MRVIAGTARRQILVTPEGNDTRPTQDIIKETLFNMIQFDVPGAVVLDLCAGSGAIGIEALSRGAKHCYFAEYAKPALACIQQNLHKTHLEEKATILKGDVVSSLHQIHEKCADIIYIDPPYDSDTAERILQELQGLPYVTKESMIILETSLTGDISYIEKLGYGILREKDYHSQRHLFLSREPK